MKTLKLLALALIFIPSALLADNHSPQVIADSWVMVPKTGHEGKFEEAMKKHLAYRKENGEKRTWDTYTAVTGDKINHYVVRSCCATWADQDTHSADSAKYSEDFNKNVHPHVKKYMHNFNVIDSKNSNWPEDTDASFVGLTTYTPVKGTGQARTKAIESMSKLAKDNNWSRNWAWTYAVGGNGSWSLVTPFKNFADMAPMEENFYQFAVKHLKSTEKADKMFENFRSTYSDFHYTIYRHRKDLSTPE